MVGLLLGERLSIGPLLVDLAAFVRLANLERLAKSKLLLGLLGEVVGVRDALVLGLAGFLARSVLG